MKIRTIGEQFAGAPDAEDYAAAASCLDPDVVYCSGNRVLRGPAAVIKAFEASGRWAREHLERINYTSTVEPRETGDVCIAFTDHITHKGHQHAYRPHQFLKVDESGRISRIEHAEIAGERERLRQFLSGLGLTPSG